MVVKLFLCLCYSAILTLSLIKECLKMISFRSPFCVTKESTTMSLTKVDSVSKETWDSHNKMMLEPLIINDSEVCVQWMLKVVHIHILETGFSRITNTNTAFINIA